MNKILPITAILIGAVLLLGCIGPGTTEKTETEEMTEEVEQGLQETEKALNSTLSDLEDFEISNLTVEEEL